MATPELPSSYLILIPPRTVTMASLTPASPFRPHYENSTHQSFFFLLSSNFNPQNARNPMSIPCPYRLTVTKILSLSFSLSGFFIKSIQNFALPLIPNPQQFLSLQSLQHNMVQTVGPTFSAAMRDRASASLNTPLTVAEAGLATWLDIYSGVLMVTVLSWFPNIPWHRQPLSAIRDLCDAYLNLFRNIIPPVIDTLDVLGCQPVVGFRCVENTGVDTE